MDVEQRIQATVVTFFNFTTGAIEMGGINPSSLYPSREQLSSKDKDRKGASSDQQSHCQKAHRLRDTGNPKKSLTLHLSLTAFCSQWL